MSTRKMSSRSRKQQILSAAMTVFADKGFEGATMDDIVAEAGLSKGGLYWHFKSKDDIITAILKAFFDDEMVTLKSAINEEGSAETRLRELAEHTGQEMARAFGLMPIALEFYAVAARQAEVRSFVSDYFRTYHEGLVQLLQQGIDAGEFRDLDVDEVATALIATFEGLAILWTVNPEAIDLPHQVSASVHLFLGGILSDENNEQGIGEGAHGQ